MKTTTLYNSIATAHTNGLKLLSVLIDPDKFNLSLAKDLLDRIPTETTHLLIGGSTVAPGKTEETIEAIKYLTNLPIILFPGDVDQVVPQADALLFLALLSGDNPEFLIGQQRKAVPKLRNSQLEVIATAYLLIDGGKTSAVERVTQTKPLEQNDVQQIKDTAKAAEYLGFKLIYLEAGSGATSPVSVKIIKEVTQDVSIPVIVGGGIRSQSQMEAAFAAGATMVVMGTAFENVLSDR